MTVAAGPSERDVIKRWQTFRAALVGEELGRPSITVELDERALTELTESRREWQDDPSLISAAELVSTGLVLGRPDLVEDAARSLDLQLLPLGVRHLFQAALTREDSMDQAGRWDRDDVQSSDRHRVVAALKRALDHDPRRAVAWLDLGRIYAEFGQLRSAERAVRTAIALAPDNRFVLRSASCFFVNLTQADRAHDLLVSSSATPTDPWLLAAELATSNAAGTKSRFMKQARQVVEDSDFSERSLSELVSEAGTFELRAGAERKARQLLRRASEDPTENAVAQVEWASRRDSGLRVPTRKLDLPSAYEARTQRALQAGEWRAGVEAAQNWLDDQPFSTVAAVVASYAALTGLRDFQLGRTLALRGLQANPSDPGLLNNAAYALIELGQPAAAAEYLRKVSVSTAPADLQIVLLATFGMLSYRHDDAETGRDMYREAMRFARQRNRAELEAMAAVMMTREELLSGGSEVQPMMELAGRLARRTSSAAVSSWLSFVENLVKAAP